MLINHQRKVACKEFEMNLFITKCTDLINHHEDRVLSGTGWHAEFNSSDKLDTEKCYDTYRTQDSCIFSFLVPPKEPQWYLLFV